MKRIVHIIGQLDVGGCELQLLGLSNRLVQRGHDVVVCSFRHGELESSFSAGGVEVKVVNRDVLNAPRFFCELRRLIKSLRPDVVHAWLPSAYFWGTWAARWAGVDRIVASERSFPNRFSFPLSISARLLGRRVLWTANSKAGAASLARFFGVPKKEVRLLRNGVSMDLPPREKARASVFRELGVTGNCPLVVMVASQSDVKNYPMFIKVATKVALHHPEAIFVGVGRARADGALEAILRERGCSNVIFVGQRTDVATWHAASDVSCLTSFCEGMPNAVLEAMFAGRPVVCTGFPSARELIESGVNGIVVPIDDSSAMAKAVLELLGSANLRSHLGERGRRRILNLHSWDVVVNEAEELYGIGPRSNSPARPDPFTARRVGL